MLTYHGELLDESLGWSKLSNLVGDLFDRLRKLGGFSRGNPGEMEPTGFYTHIFNEIFEEGEFSSGIIITFQVMAVSRVSA